MTPPASPFFSARPADVPARPLLRHPASPQQPHLSLHASVWRGAHAQLDGWYLQYELSGEVSQIRMPAPQAPTRADGLWKHTCFEAFVGLRADTAYREFNFSPSGQWAAYAFSDQRQRDLNAEAMLPAFAPALRSACTANTFVLQAWLPDTAWPVARSTHSLELGLSAVIEWQDGSLSHWALHHPQPQPDFHHRSAFVGAL